MHAVSEWEPCGDTARLSHYSSDHPVRLQRGTGDPRRGTPVFIETTTATLRVEDIQAAYNKAEDPDRNAEECSRLKFAL
jgi:hypothetical protein